MSSSMIIKKKKKKTKPNLSALNETFVDKTDPFHQGPDSI